MQALNAAALAALPRGVAGPAYDRRTVRAGIAHLSVGNFHRAHQAWYIDRLLAEPSQQGWGICGIGFADEAGADEAGAEAAVRAIDLAEASDFSVKVATVSGFKDAADAAKALEPLVQSFPNAGYIAKLLFAIGVIGLGLLAVPVLSASASYALSETLNWREGLNLKLKRAHGFYGVITIATIVGLMINFIGINPIKALVFTAVFNGVAAVPLIFIIARMAASKKIMGEYKSGWLSNIVVWATFVLMAAAAVAMFATL